MSRTRHHDQFTCIELLLALGLIILLALGVLSAIGPHANGAFERNAQRIDDLRTIERVLTACLRDDTCSLRPSIGPSPTPLCRTDEEACTSGIRMHSSSGVIVLPTDPLAHETGTGTLYTILRTGSGLLLSAPLAEDSVTIELLMRE